MKITKEIIKDNVLIGIGGAAIVTGSFWLVNKVYLYGINKIERNSIDESKNELIKKNTELLEKNMEFENGEE